ncbi:hypothetical protein VARIO8X_90018 [Burkholderiales bacterium 8X]|nr:hypothetical protein VARIO8X_90018 [Burkholderiales bacterium 8X]
MRIRAAVPYLQFDDLNNRRSCLDRRMALAAAASRQHRLARGGSGGRCAGARRGAVGDRRHRAQSRADHRCRPHAAQQLAGRQHHAPACSICCARRGRDHDRRRARPGGHAAGARTARPARRPGHLLLHRGEGARPAGAGTRHRGARPQHPEPHRAPSP